ncbi:MAG TPA: hypothetical protein VD791_03600 [Burkholderiales bacterium]|nr:hypothetical protein [Burkholderiales bacterium]
MLANEAAERLLARDAQGAASVLAALKREDPAYPAAGALSVLALDREREGSSRALIGLRQRLRDLNRDLFALYMQRRTVFHR